MKLYAAIDLHSNNHFVVVVDEYDKPVISKKMPNHLEGTVKLLAPYRQDITGIAVESTFNWCWLVDGLMAEGYTLHLVNTTAVQSYHGLKYCDDKGDAMWLARLLRLNILPTGYIYPIEDRPVRELLRQRVHLIESRTSHVLRLQSYFDRNDGIHIKTDTIYQSPEILLESVERNSARQLWVSSQLNTIGTITDGIIEIESELKGLLVKNDDFRILKTAPGIGDILGMTVLLETGPIGRFNTVGNYASYCRLVDSKYMSNGKRKGQGNVRCGNRYLSWAYSQVAHHATIHNPTIKRFNQKKLKQSGSKMIAIRAVAHKMARACYHMLKNQESFNLKLAFG